MWAISMFLKIGQYTAAQKYPDLFRYSSPDKYIFYYSKVLVKSKFKLNDGEPWGAKAVANRMYVKWKDDKQQTSLDAVKTKFAGEEAFLLKVTLQTEKLYTIGSS